MKKRICSLLLALAVLLSVLPMAAAADYRLLYSRVAVSGGEVQIEITGYTGTLPERLVIPEQIEGLPVRSVAHYAFRDAAVREVVFPGTIVELNTQTFAGNNTLEAVTIGEGTQTVSSAFKNCGNLKSVTLPSTLRELGPETFSYTALESVQLPAGLKVIGEKCFQFSKLRSIVLPEGLERIESCAFWGNEAQGRLIIPASVQYLGNISFSDNAFSDAVILPETVEIDGLPFGGHTVVYAHESVLESSVYAGFPGNHWISFEELPYDVLTQPVYTEGAIQYTTVDGQAYVISCNASGDLTVPDTLGGCPVKALLPSAFFRASKLTHLVLPDSIEEIGKRCFYNCSVTLERLPRNLKKIGFAAFYTENEMTLLDGTFPEGITELPKEAFHGTRMENIVLPAGLERLEENALSGTCAQSITFLGGVKYVEGFALYGLNAKEIVFPEGLEKLGGWALANAGRLEKLTLPRTLKELGDYVFGYTPPKNLTVYGYSDTPALDYCLNEGIRFVDIETGETAAKIYETEVDGVKYRVNPTKKCASIIGCVPEKLDSVLVLPDTVDGCSVTRIESWGLSRVTCRGIVLPDTLTFIADLAITSADQDLPLFLSMPDNEVYIFRGFYDANVSYCYLPEGFSLTDDCVKNAPELLPTMCIGFEKHTAIVPNNRLITIDAHADSRHFLSPGGVFRLDGEELTAIYLVNISELTNTFQMVSSVGGFPVTRIEATCTSYNSTVILGDFVRIVDDGAFAENDAAYINNLYLPPCIEYLPPDLLPCPGITTIYGTTGTYAEKYAKEHGCRFLDMQKTPFRDVPESAWYFPYVREVYWYHIMNGTGTDTFEPEATTTRAMVVQVLYNMSGGGERGNKVFRDVNEGDWYFNAVGWAWLHGVCNGTSETTFSPNDPVTREQLAAFLYRYAGLCGFECKPDGDLSAYKDKNQISSYAYDAISWAVGAGIINGTSATTIEPRSCATRAEIATMICRLLDYAAQSAPPTE